MNYLLSMHVCSSTYIVRGVVAQLLASLHAGPVIMGLISHPDGIEKFTFTPKLTQSKFGTREMSGES